LPKPAEGSRAAHLPLENETKEDTSGQTAQAKGTEDKLKMTAYKNLEGITHQERTRRPSVDFGRIALLGARHVT